MRILIPESNISINLHSICLYIFKQVAIPLNLSTQLVVFQQHREAAALVYARVYEVYNSRCGNWHSRASFLPAVLREMKH